MSNLVHINQLPPDARLIGFGHRSGAETHKTKEDAANAYHKAAADLHGEFAK